MKDMIYEIWFIWKEDDSFQKMISKKKFDDFMECSKIIPTEKMFYRTFLLSKWKDDL